MLSCHACFCINCDVQYVGSVSVCKLAVLQVMLCKPDIASLSSFISRLEIQIFLILFSFMEHSMKHQSQLLNPQIKMKRSCYETVVLELTGNW